MRPCGICYCVASHTHTHTHTRPHVHADARTRPYPCGHLFSVHQDCRPNPHRIISSMPRLFMCNRSHLTPFLSKPQSSPCAPPPPLLPPSQPFSLLLKRITPTFSINCALCEEAADLSLYYMSHVVSVLQKGAVFQICWEIVISSAARQCMFCNILNSRRTEKCLT